MKRYYVAGFLLGAGISIVSYLAEKHEKKNLINAINRDIENATNHLKQASSTGIGAFALMDKFDPMK